jgi:hypothetical protein
VGSPNSILFGHKPVQTFWLFARIVSFLKIFKAHKVKLPRQIGELLIDKSRCRGFFDGTSQGPRQFYSIGGVLLFSNSHYITFKANLDEGTNNYAKLMALRTLLQLSIEHHIQYL